MSAAVAASGSGGMDGDDDKKRKRALPVDAPDPFSESSDDTDDESAPIEKPKGLSPHCPGKSKSFGDLTKLGNMRTEEIVKKEKTKYKKPRIEMHRETGEAKKKIENTIGRLAATTLDLADEDPEEGEVDNDDDKKATDEEEDDAEKSKGGASGSQSDHSMAEAVNDEDKKATDEKEEDAEKSKGGASGSQSDHSMAEAGSSGDIAKTDDMVRDSKTDEQNGGKK